MQACATFNVTLAPVVGTAGRHRLSVILSSRVQYAVRSVYTMMIRAVVRIRSRIVVS